MANVALDIQISVLITLARAAEAAPSDLSDNELLGWMESHHKAGMKTRNIAAIAERKSMPR